MTRTTKEQLIEFAGDEPEERDAIRYQWLKERLLGADFAWGDPQTCVWVFETDAPISADLDESIDAAIRSEA